MNILIIPSWYPSDEHPVAGIFIHQQAKALIKEGHNVAVLAITQGQYAKAASLEIYDGVDVVRMVTGFEAEGRSFLRKKIDGLRYRKMWLTGMKKEYYAAYDVLIREGFHPDIIHVHALWPAGLGAAQISRKYQIPFVVTEHSEEYAEGTTRKLINMPGMLPFVLRPIAHKASAYIAVSSIFAKRLEELRLAQKVYVVPNVVPERSDVVEYQYADSKIHFVHISQAGPAKNLKMLLNAVSMLAKRRDDFVLEIAGEGEDTKSLIELAKKLNIFNSHVRFSGVLLPRNANKLLDSSAFGVLSSTHETFSVFAAECLMAGRPVVSTKCGGPEDFITSDVGLLVENDDEESMTNGLDWMLSHYCDFSPQVLNRYARDRFSEKAVVKKLGSIYRGVLNNEC